jgi:hypothetical protein
MSRHCGECNFFSHESIDGYGWCDVTGREQRCSDRCTLSRENITDKQALRVLHYAQKWRRGANTECVNPYVFGIAIDRAIKVLRKEVKDESKNKENRRNP